jgi:hypothetical protein
MASHGREVFREHPSRCLSALEVAGVSLAGYKMVSDGLGPRDSCIWIGRCAFIRFWVCGGQFRWFSLN